MLFLYCFGKLFSQIILTKNNIRDIIKTEYFEEDCVLKKYNSDKQPKSERITRLVANLYKKMPEIEADRGVLVTESYRETEGEPIITRRAKAFAHPAFCRSF